ncbi:MAG: LacI family DNA-binding transcriptional regulator [Oscillospiraceae bacterium]
MKNKSITILEIAKLANTSVATVSRVLSGADYPVSIELRKKIQKIAKETNYVPNTFSQALKGGKSKDIGVIIPNFTNPFYMQLISGIEYSCRSKGFNPIFCSSNNSDVQELANVDLLSQKCVEGLIISSICHDTDALQAAFKKHKNVVLFDQEIKFSDCDYVSFDFFEGGYLAASHLLAKGHRNIAFLTSPLKNRSSRQSLYNGCLKAIAEYAHDGARCTLVSSDINVEDYMIWEYENGHCLADKFLELDPMPTAAFVYNDITAFSTMTQLAAKGIKIPEDVSVVGFDNIVMSEYFSPPLTTISQPAFDTGALASKIVLEKIDSNFRTNSHVILSPSLIERASVKDINK